MLQLLFERVITAGLTIPTLQDWLIAVGLVGLYTLVALPLGFRSQFIQVSPPKSGRTIFTVCLVSFFTPGLLEEVIFRVLLLPHPSENSSAIALSGWIGLSLLLFLISHPLNAYTLFKAARPIFVMPIFLTLAGLLGIVCTISYLQSGSLWPPMVMHWLIVVLWLLFFGGHGKLYA